MFFGNIVPYKGLEYLLDAVRELVLEDEAYRLIIAGRSQVHDAYWKERIKPRIEDGSNQLILRTSFVPDEDVEVYFKAADVLVLPYLAIFQSGVLFLAYAFGLPVVACDVGALRDDILVGKTGYVCPPRDVRSLKGIIAQFFSSPLFSRQEQARQFIVEYAADRYAWEKVGRKTKEIYSAVSGQTLKSGTQ